MILLYVSYVYHMNSGMIKVVVSAFEIYVADVISRQHIGDKIIIDRIRVNIPLTL